MLPPSFQVCFLKLFISLILSRKARTNDPISQLLGRITKNLRTIWICVDAEDSWSEMTLPPEIRGALSPKVKNHSKLDKNGLFLFGAPRVLSKSAISFSWIVAQMQNYNNAQVFVTLEGVDHHGSVSGHLERDRIKLEFWGRTYHPNTFAPKNCSALISDAKCHVDVDYTIENCSA